MSSRIETLLNDICIAREYTLMLLRDLSEDDWFRMPSEGVTHISWQAGHLAWAEYRLVFGRVIGKDQSTRGILPESFDEVFGKGSIPIADSSRYPSPEEILAVMGSIHQEVCDILPSIDDSTLNEPTEPVPPVFSDKAGALRWCSQHELVHAGQIALLRRLFGYPPTR